MNSSRKIIYSLLALPLVFASVSLLFLDSTTRSGFFDDYSRNLGRLFAGDWHVSEMTDQVPRVAVPGNGRNRGYRSNAVDIFKKLDRNGDAVLESAELGTRMAAMLEQTVPTTLEEFEQAMWRQSSEVSSGAGRSEASAEPAMEISDADAAADVKLTDVKLLDPTHVVTVDIQLSEQDWTALCNQSRSHRTAVENPLAKPYTNFRGNVTVDGVLISDVAIRKKGFIGSQDRVRPSLKIKFDEFVEQTPVAGLDRLTLNNNRQDRALVSQSLTYYLFRKAGLPAPRSNFAAVTVNGKYLGIYSHVESVKKPFLSRAFGNDSGSLYEGTLTDLYPESIEWFERKTNKSQDNRESLLSLATVLRDESTTTADIAKIVDLDAFVKFWVIENLINFWDGYNQNQNNFFIYENPANERMYFIPWGADSCFGGRPHFVQRFGEVSEAVRATSILSNKLYHFADIPNRYREVMQEVLAETWDEEELLTEIDRIESLLLDQLDFQQVSSIIASDDTRRFIRARRQIIQTELAEKWPPEIARGPRIPQHTIAVGHAHGSFYRDDEGSFQVDGTITLDDEMVEFESIEIDAESIFLGSADETQSFGVLLDLGLNALEQETAKLDVTGEFTRRGRRGIKIRGHVTRASSKLSSHDLTRAEFDLEILETRGGFMDRNRRH